DLPVAELTQQYLDYLEQFKKFNIEIASEFLVMAATLLLIKSRMMLPKPSKEKDEEEEDPRQELLERILEYRRFKELTKTMAALAARESHYLSREPMDIPIKHLPPENLSIEALIDAFHNVMDVHRELAIPNEIVAHEEFRVQDQMLRILTLLDEHGGTIFFNDMFEVKGRSACIAAFLALLELVHRRTITVTQSMIFSPIVVAYRSSDMSDVNDINEGIGEEGDIFDKSES
ncbi:MAG: segregation and condensation protein A, partial [Selenomonadaceae bacterium]